MEDLLANAPLPTLLGLMFVPLVGVILLSSYLYIAFSRGKKKSKMKLGNQSKSSPLSASPLPTSTVNLDTSILTSSSLPIEPGHELNSHVSNQQPVPLDQNPLASQTEARLNPGSAAKQNHREVLPMATPNQTNSNEIDLAARLNDLSASAPSPSPEPVELLRLLRDPKSGQLVIEIAGQRYFKLTDIADRDIGQFVLKLAAHLLAFTNGMIATDAGLKTIYNPKVGKAPRPVATKRPSSPPARPVQPPPQPVQPAPVVSPPSLDAESALLASLQAQSEQPEEKPKARGLFGRVKPDPEPQLLPVLNLAEEINNIVQTRLMASPLAATTRIEITSDLGGGIRINVNDHIYTTPDDVPNPEIRQLIKDGIKQWERS